MKFLRRFFDEGAAGGDNGDGGGAPAGGGTNGAPEWMTGFSEQYQNDQSLRRFKSLDALAGAFINTRNDLRTRARKGSVMVPGQEATDEDKALYREQMGIPADADSYRVSFDVTADASRPEIGTIPANAEHTKKFKELAHEIGLSQDQAQKIAALQVDIARDHVIAKAESDRQNGEATQAALTELYGENLPAKRELIKPLHEMFGATEGADTDWLQRLFAQEYFPGGFAKSAAALRFLINIGEAVASDRFADGGGDNRGGEPGSGGGAPALPTDRRERARVLLEGGFKYPTMEGGVPGQSLGVRGTN